MPDDFRLPEEWRAEIRRVLHWKLPTEQLAIGRDVSLTEDISTAIAPHVRELVQILQFAIDNLQGVAEGTDLPSLILRQKGRAILAKFRGGSND